MEGEVFYLQRIVGLQEKLLAANEQLDEMTRKYKEVYHIFEYITGKVIKYETFLKEKGLMDDKGEIIREPGNLFSEDTDDKRDSIDEEAMYEKWEAER